MKSAVAEDIAESVSSVGNVENRLRITHLSSINYDSSEAGGSTTEKASAAYAGESSRTST